jgi:hypothetical protein
MATTFVHIGDFHAAAGPRNADRYQALEQIQAAGEALAARGALGAWLWPGDLNDARMTIEDRNRLAAVLIDLARIAPVVICDGNHDLPGDLDIFEHLGGRYPIYVIHVPHCLRIELATGEDATIFVLPYPQKAGLVSAGIATGDVVSTAADLLEPIFMQAAAELETARAQGDLTLMIGHVNIAGSIASTGQPNIGHEIELNPKHLDRLGDIPKLLNHIHKPQEVAGAHYAGSVCRLNYGEAEEKSFIVLTVDAAGWSIERQPIDVAPMHHVTGVLTRAGFRFDDAECDQRLSWAGCDVRVRYTYKASEKASLDDSVIHALFSSALRLKVEGVAIADRELRAPEVAAAKTLPEKLAAYRKVAQLEPSVASKLSILQSETPEHLLEVVAVGLAMIEQPEKFEVAA